MILPIVAYGSPILRKVAEEIDANFPNLKALISDMFDTLYATDGVGLAAPQVSKSIRLVVIDATPFEDEEKGLKGFKKVIINPKIIERKGEPTVFNEGCLSVPGIREDVFKHPVIRIEYYDEKFVKHDEVYKGIASRIIQHEYDHLEGVLFTDYCPPLKKRLMKRKLTDITKGIVNVKYKMKFPKKIN